MELQGPAKAAADAMQALSVATRSGIVRPARPDRLLRAGLALHRWGASPATGFQAGSVLRPDHEALIDEKGALTYREVDERTTRLANALSERGIGEGDGVAFMMRNHRYFVEALVAGAKLGSQALLMNTMFSGPQLAEVAEREEPKALIYDAEFAELLEGVDHLDQYVAWHDENDDLDATTLDDLIEEGADTAPSPPDTQPRFTVLTSGTTGTPKGAQRKQPDSIQPIIGLLSKINYRGEERTHVAAPLFHSWGFLNFNIGLALGSTAVLRSKFDAEQTLKTIDEYGCTALVVVPVMMQRIMRLDDEVKENYDLSKLRVVAVSGSALPGDLSTNWMDTFGDNLYNLYGSTEVGWASIATPEDLRKNPDTAGKAPMGTTLKIVDDDDNEVEQGETGRIFVGNDLAFEGYTGGGGKDEIDGMLSSGDVGYLDEDGRLFIEGRDDDMIVSGGENIFPREVEDLIAEWDEVDEVAVVGVDDEEWGKRLAAHVVTKDGKSLDEDDVKERVKENLASFKVPRDVHFIDELPRNATGKVLKNELGEGEGDEDAEDESDDDSDAAQAGIDDDDADAEGDADAEKSSSSS